MSARDTRWAEVERMRREAEAYARKSDMLDQQASALAAKLRQGAS